jgi:hypothetical protein
LLRSLHIAQFKVVVIDVIVLISWLFIELEFPLNQIQLMIDVLELIRIETVISFILLLTLHLILLWISEVVCTIGDIYTLLSTEVLMVAFEILIFSRNATILISEEWIHIELMSRWLVLITNECLFALLAQLIHPLNVVLIVHLSNIWLYSTLLVDSNALSSFAYILFYSW